MELALEVFSLYSLMVRKKMKDKRLKALKLLDWPQQPC